MAKDTSNLSDLSEWQKVQGQSTGIHRCPSDSLFSSSTFDSSSLPFLPSSGESSPTPSTPPSFPSQGLPTYSFVEAVEEGDLRRSPSRWKRLSTEVKARGSVRHIRSIPGIKPLVLKRSYLKSPNNLRRPTSSESSNAFQKTRAHLREQVVFNRRRSFPHEAPDLIGDGLPQTKLSSRSTSSPLLDAAPVQFTSSSVSTAVPVGQRDSVITFDKHEPLFPSRPFTSTTYSTATPIDEAFTANSPHTHFEHTFMSSTQSVQSPRRPPPRRPLLRNPPPQMKCGAKSDDVRLKRVTVDTLVNPFQEQPWPQPRSRISLPDQLPSSEESDSRQRMSISHLLSK